MCIICNNEKLGEQYLEGQYQFRKGCELMEDALLKLSRQENINYKPSKKKAQAYDRAHKKLVRLRKEINKIDEIRENVELNN